MVIWVQAPSSDVPVFLKDQFDCSWSHIRGQNQVRNYQDWGDRSEHEANRVI